MTCHLVRYEFFLVFVLDDPRHDGCLDPIEDDVWLDDAGLTDPSTGRTPPGLCVGRNPVDERHYRPFRSPADRSRAGFHQVVGVPVAARSWDAFLSAAADCGEPVG
jgi:hypothetical protein